MLPEKFVLGTWTAQQGHALRQVNIGYAVTNGVS